MNNEEQAKLITYNNRELSWMDFNIRVLEEAFEKENPIMDRVNFLSITASNLDEFFMVRVAGIMEQIRSKYNKKDDSLMTPNEVMSKLNIKIHSFTEKQYSCFNRSIIPALKKENIYFAKVEDLNKEQKNYINEYFDKVLFPVLTPLAVDKSRPFPLLANKSLNIAVRLTAKDGKSNFAVIQVPSILPRFLELDYNNGRMFILLEDIIIASLSKLFELHEISAYCTFRVTRNSDLDINEESEDLIIAIERSIKKRKRGKPVRLEIIQNCDKDTKAFLVEMLNVAKKSIYEVPGPIDLTFLSKFCFMKSFEHLHFPKILPVDPPADFWGYSDMFEAIREKDRLVHHPYESFSSVVRLVKDAAKDPNVLAIKQTLYRVSGKSPIIDYLIKAAENGKQVTVLVELKARFDEENNINWAKKLEHAGCHVIYGLLGLKTHCKILLIVRREEDGIRRYLHLGTGNYNDSTAKLYTDIGMFTCREKYGIDASSLFNVLTGYSRPPEYNKFIVAPQGMRKFFENMIKNEIKNAKKGIKSGITVKINSLVDSKIINLLYDASCAGVKINLIVRGICCLVPGVKDISENIRVISIVGQLLEHSRIFLFENAGDTKIYLGSADWMPRNLDRRVELVFPVEDEDLKQRLLKSLDIMLKDTVNARIQLPNTKYVHIDKRGKAILNSHLEFSKLAKEALKLKSERNDEKPYVPLNKEKVDRFQNNV